MEIWLYNGIKQKIRKMRKEMEGKRKKSKK
jgi:hypothetical protein